MATGTVQHRVEKPTNFRSSDAALIIASLDKQSRSLWHALRDITPDELQWQQAPGMNTIGMLLTHLAIAEFWWTKVMLEMEEPGSVEPVIGVAGDDDGMPLQEDAAPPACLNGKDLAYFSGLNDKARAYTVKNVAGLTDNDLESEVVQTRPDGTIVSITLCWYLYHILEHFSSHHGQILLLRHLYRNHMNHHASGRP